jgi:hypothetical protein
MSASIVKQYVDGALAQMRRLNLMRSPGKLPDEMRDSSVTPSKDWLGWKAIPSTVTDRDLHDLEGEIKLVFPPMYREFLKYVHFVNLDETAIRFEKHLIHEWKETLRKNYFRGWPRERILDIGLIPFGDECRMDAGPVCFDTRKRLPDGECPIVFWDHEWVNTKHEIKPLFSSAAKMFACLAFTTSTDLNFLVDLEDDDEQVLETKADLRKKFLEIDPDGAGGVAREYWEP